MIWSGKKRLLFWSAWAALAGSLSAVGACASTDSTGTPSAQPPVGTPDATPGDAAEADGSLPGQDASNDAGLDAPRDANTRDANGPGMANAVCSFNWDCQSALRCECDEATGCACKPGARGAGRNGIDPCTSSNACASAVCVEGPPDSGSFCSDECGTSADCVGKLPQCKTIAFVGRICIRTAP